MNSLNKICISLIALLLVTLCPLQSLAEENFWGDTVDSQVNNIQPPSAVQTETTPEFNTSAEKTKNTKGSKIIKDIASYMQYPQFAEAFGVNTEAAKEMIQSMAVSIERKEDQKLIKKLATGLKNLGCI